MSISSSGVALLPRLYFKIAILAVVALFGCEYLKRDRSFSAGQRAGVGEKLGEVSLQPLTGNPPPLDSKDLAGHVALLNFWGPWCGPCKMELPHLVDLNRRLAGHADFRFVAVACGDRDETLDSIREQTESYLSGVELALETYADRGSVTRDMLAKKCDMQGYPFTVLLDRGGVVRGIWEGYIPGSETEMEKSILDLLGAVASAAPGDGPAAAPPNEPAAPAANP